MSNVDNFGAGPDNKSVLTLQRYHRSQAILEGEELPELVTRIHLKTSSRFKVHPRVEKAIVGTQFWGLHRLCFVPLDSGLITALVERWRQETHTFHLPFGETTVTLQDVNVLLGLRVGGRPVTGRGNYPWTEYVQQSLGVTPQTDDIKGGSLKLTWLRANFENMPNDASDQQLHQYVRAYILYLFGSVLFTNKSGNSVPLVYLPLIDDLEQIDSYSWGSAALACLYRNLCRASTRLPNAATMPKQIGGPLILLQLWSWERITFGRPEIIRSHVRIQEGQAYPLGSQMVSGVDPLGCRWLRVDRRFLDHKPSVVIYRDAMDMMTESQFTWQPYTMDVLTHCRPICYEDMDEWIVVAPLILFEIVECHLPNRCVRQFGWHQEVPPLFNTSVELHAIDRRKNIQDYAFKHAHFIGQWENRKANMVERGHPYVGLMNPRDPYLRWYKSITLHQISPQCRNTNLDYGDHHYYYPTAADYEQLTASNVYTYQQSTQLLDKMAFTMPLEASRIICNMQRMSLQTLQNTRQGHRIFNEQSDEELNEDDAEEEKEGDEEEEGEEEAEDEEGEEEAEGEGEEEEQQPEVRLSPPRYNFRNLRRVPQPSEVGESSSKPKKKSKRRFFGF